MRCAHTFVGCLVFALGVGGSASTAQTPPPQTPPPQTPTAPAPEKPAQPPVGKPRQAAAAPASRLTLTLMVTALDGKTLPDVLVKASGPVDREGQTDPSGLVNFQNMSPGTYRVRFEHDEFVTFEKEVSLAAGKPLRVNAALSAAPPPPPPAKPEPVAPSPVAVPDGNYQPSSVAILELLDKNFIGTAPSKRSPLGCTASSTSTFVQTRESTGEHVHSDTDEILYVLSGEATHRIGGKEQAVGAHTFLVIPRGISHSLTRKGRNPLTMVSIMSGQPCQADKQ